MASFFTLDRMGNRVKEIALMDMTTEDEENETLVIHGRHDPCIVPRAVPCVEAAAAIAVLDAWMGRKKETGYEF